MRCPLILICLLLIATTVFGDIAPTPVWRLLYAPLANSSISQKLKVDLLDVTLEGASTYMTGTASTNVLLNFGEPPSDNSATAMTVTVSKMQGLAIGEPLAVTGPEVIEVTVDDQARVVAYQVKQRVSNADPTAITSADALTALAILAALPPLPTEPVAPDNQWHSHQTITLREVGQATVDMQCRLMEISQEQIVIESSGQARMPEVQIPNPFAPSGTMKATNLKVKVTRLHQTCDRSTLMVRKTQCEAAVSFDGVAPDYTLPLAAKLEFSLTPSASPAGE